MEVRGRMNEHNASYRTVSSGAILTAGGKTHDCSAYCRPPIHAHVVSASDDISETDIIEGLTELGFPQVEQIHVTTEGPTIGRTMDPSGATITKCFVVWVDYTKRVRV